MNNNEAKKETRKAAAAESHDSIRANRRQTPSVEHVLTDTNSGQQKLNERLHASADDIRSQAHVRTSTDGTRSQAHERTNAGGIRSQAHERANSDSIRSRVPTRVSADGTRAGTPYHVRSDIKAESDNPTNSTPTTSAELKNASGKRSLKNTIKDSALSKDGDIPQLKRYKGSIDRVFLALVLILICFGSVMVFSASYAYSMFQDPGNGYYYIEKQIKFVILGLIFMFVVSLIDTELIRRFSPLTYWLTIALLGLVFLIGSVGGGAKRWIIIAGVSVQPSEIAKATLVLMLAVHMEKYSEKINNNPDFWNSVKYGIGIPLFYIGLVCTLVVIEKHVSGTVILFLIGVILMWAGGGNKKFLFICSAGGSTIIALIAVIMPYAKRRIEIWMDPAKDITGSGWQTIQGLRAIGSGGLFGLGPTNSRQKHMYVSQPQNDFIFSILCEELGFLGALAVILLFVALIIRGYKIATKAPDSFTSLVVTGIVSKVGLQAALNIGVVTNTLPNTGISLPFFSYGGSSTVVLLAEMGIVLSISRFSRQDR